MWAIGKTARLPNARIFEIDVYNSTRQIVNSGVGVESYGTTKYLI